MNFWTGIILATIFLLVTIVIFATKIFFPYHRIIALIIYGIGWIPFLYSISLRKKWILQHKGAVTSFLQMYWIHIVFGVLMVLMLYVFLTLFPPVKSPFAELNDQEITQILEEDKTVILYLNDKLANTLDEAEKHSVLTIDFTNITGNEKQALQNTWISFVEAILELDLLKERYKTFYQLNAITKKDLHRQAFENGYAALLMQHYYTLQITKNISNPNIITYLNQSFETQGITSGTFDMLQKKLIDTDGLLQLNTGRAYYLLIRNKNSNLDKLITSYLKSIDESLGSYANLLAKKPLNFLEKNSFKLWFPIQKQSAMKISYIKTSTRDYHINAQLINEYKDKFLPGDILLERREWHATNIGIPGFWTHNALYIGTLNEMNAYFNNLPELNGKTFKEFLKNNYHTAYEKMLQADEDGYEYAVVESKRPGVILTSLEYTANADSFASLRVKGTNKSDHFKIVTQALSHLGKPYDFDFNFVTDDTLVCSELVYKAYLDIKQLNIELREINGRPIISPNQFAEKFANEFKSENTELELILFLDGNEKSQTATEKNADTFEETWQRPKWHIAKDFVDFQ